MENLTFLQLKAGYEKHQIAKQKARERYYRWKEKNPEKWEQNIKYYNEKKREKKNLEKSED